MIRYELISFVRGLERWRPSYRYKWIDGYISGWDTEWCYHLPFPFLGVEWFDIALQRKVHVGRLVDPQIIDHSRTILEELQKIGFDFEINSDVARIWGYLPRCYTDFQPRDMPGRIR